MRISGLKPGFNCCFSAHTTRALRLRLDVLRIVAAFQTKALVDQHSGVF